MPKTSPRQTRKIATIVSIEISMGKEDADDICDVAVDIDAVVID